MHDIDTGKVSGQAAFEKMLALHAANEVSNTQNLKTARDGEIAKLGATGSARVTAVQNFINAQLGEADGKFFTNMLVTAKHVEGFERLMAAFRSQGAGSFTHAHRDANEAPKISQADYDRMTYSQKKEYAAAHAPSGRPN